MERDRIPHPQGDIYWSQQNYLHNSSPAVGGGHSQFPHHGSSARDPNFYHHMPDYHHSYAQQSHGSSEVVHSRNPSVRDSYTSFPSHQARGHILHPNIDRSQQNHLHSVPRPVGGHISQFPQHGIGETNHNIHHHMPDYHIGLMSNYAPQSYSSSEEIRSRNPSFPNRSDAGFPSHQPMVEQLTVMDFLHGINVHEVSLDIRETRSRQYQEHGMYSFIDSHPCPPYTDFYQPHPNQQQPHTQAMSRSNFNLQPQVLSASSYGHQIYNPQQHYNSHSSWGSRTIDENRNFRSSIPVDQMMSQEVLSPEDNTIDSNRLVFLPADDVMILNVSHALHPWLVDEVMLITYEELIDLQEEIGHVSTGLSEEEIQRHLKTRTHIAPANRFDLNEIPRSKRCKICVNQLDSNEALPDSDDEPDICVVCQVEYENWERIGTLECGHEYHAECIKKWLQEKNVCPICKATALNTGS